MVMNVHVHTEALDPNNFIQTHVAFSFSSTELCRITCGKHLCNFNIYLRF